MTQEQELLQRMQDMARQVDGLLAARLDAMPSVPTRLRAAMRHGLLAGGKRLRPFLVVESAALFGVATPMALPTAAAVECIHAYSLVHDDLPVMDNDRLRRGQPTVWVAFDEWTAILAGDALLTLAFELVAGADAHADPAVRAELAVALAKAAGAAGMVGGQALDLAAEKRQEPPRPDAAHIRKLQAMKTGALISFCCVAGGMLGGAGAAERVALERYGAALGLAFQMSDDLLDVTGSMNTVGKATGKDAAQGKATLIGLIGPDAARTLLAEAVTEAKQALAAFGDRAATLVALAHAMTTRTM